MSAPRTSLKMNVAANYAGQLYATAISVLLLPLQVKALGAEGYGLVGFFAVLSGWLQLLDVGMSATLSRETAKYRARVVEQGTYRRLLRAIELLFLCVGVVVALSVVALSGLISRRWLHAEALAPSTIARAVALMGLVFAFRWQATLSRSVLVGLEHLVSVNILTAASATLRSVGVLLALRWVEPTPGVFFVYQAVVAALELVVLRFSASRALAFPKSSLESPSLDPIRQVAGFSLRVAFSGAVWTVVTQLDKLLLSNFLPLSEYAWFSVAVTAASGISVLSGPIGQAVQPRLTYFFAIGNDGAFRTTYSEATQMLSAIALTASLFTVVAGRHLLWVWTGDVGLAARVAPVFSLYALGNGLLAVVAMTYYLQVARGDLRLHVAGNVVFALILVPTIAFATTRGGMLGAGIAWCGANLFYFLAWTAIVHNRFLSGLHLRWLLRDVALPCAAGSLPSLSFGLVHWAALSRLEAAALLCLLGLASIGLASLMTEPVQRVLRGRNVSLS